jgi:hypothetical protein
VQGDRVEFADREALAIREQMVKVPAPVLEFGARIEDLAEDVLDDTDVLANAERTATPVFDVGRGREVVRVDVGPRTIWLTVLVGSSKNDATSGRFAASPSARGNHIACPTDGLRVVLAQWPRSCRPATMEFQAEENALRM